MDEQQIAEYVQWLSSALLELSLRVRQEHNPALSAKLLPLLEGTAFGFSEQTGCMDIIHALRAEFPLDEEEDDEAEEDSEEDSEASEA